MRPANPTYGVPKPADVAGMTGKEYLQAISDGRLPAPPIAKQLNMWLAEVGDGFTVFEGDTGPELLNPQGTVHGGWRSRSSTAPPLARPFRCCRPESG